jgi:alanyl-tRNA synthetase
VDTEKLYYQDPYIQSFSAEILQSKKDDKGRFYAVLNKTAFYPAGGGQPHDTGTINDVHVYDVKEEKGEIRHYTETPVQERKVNGVINWVRRFGHMQQHAGQHLLSAAFEDMYGYRTTSFHLGSETCTIDLDTPELSEKEANQVEENVNSVILNNLPIQTRWVKANELSHFPLRKAVSKENNIRLVIIPDIDYNGCGGTHPHQTGEVGSVKILHWEKQKKQIRVHFVCGNRVLKQLETKHRVIRHLTSMLSAPQEDLENALARMLNQQRSLEKSNGTLKLELLSHETDKLIQQAKQKDDYKLVSKIYVNRPVKLLQQMAKNITQTSGNMLVLFVNETDAKLQIVGARSKDMDMRMKEFLSRILPGINGKGGGSETMVQGAGDRTISSDKLMEKMTSIIEEIK